MNEKKTIQENNKLIAEFMGYTYYPYKKEEKGLPCGWIKGDRNVANSKLGGLLCRTHSALSYHFYWNSLMEVVEKIETIKGHDHGQFVVVIKANSCTIFGSKLHFVGYGNVYDRTQYNANKITATWSAVVYFIKWYLKNKQVID